jgi:hypothetical protein
MNKSTLQAINQIIDTDDCPFTQFEVHGFFIGLLVSSHSQRIKKRKNNQIFRLVFQSQYK